MNLFTSLIMIFFSSVVAFKGMGASCLRLSGATTRLFSSSISESVKAAIKNNNVIVYSKTYCSYCAKAKNALSELKVDYVVVELNVVQDGRDIEAALIELTGQRTVPNIFVKGTHLGGCDKTLEAISTGKFQKLLQGQ